MKYFFATLLVVFVALFLYVWWRIRKETRLHVNSNKKLSAQFPLPHQTVLLKTEDGNRISAWYISVPSSKAVIILLHGFTPHNGGKELMLPHADYLVKAGYSVILPDLRANGDSEGDQAYLGAREWKDAEAAYDYVVSLKENKGKKIGYFGISMGATVALSTIGKTQKGDFVIASVPFKSIKSQFRYQLKKEGLPVWLMFPILDLAGRIEYGWQYDANSPDRMIDSVTKPILLFSASHDRDVSPQDAIDLFEKAREPKKLIQTNTQHDIYDEEPALMRESVLTFLRSL